MRNPRSRRWNLALTMLLVLMAVVPVAYAIACYQNIDVYWEDGSVQHCGTFCTWRGGWSCR